MTWRSGFEPGNGHATHTEAPRVFGPLAVVAVVSGCASFGVGYDIERMRDVYGVGDDFTQALTQDHYPITLLNAGVRTRISDLADHPQGCFDCWFEPQEGNFQPGHGAACRDALCAAPQKLGAAMAPKLEPKAETAPSPAGAPDHFLLYFTFDSDKLTAAGDLRGGARLIRLSLAPIIDDEAPSASSRTCESGQLCRIAAFVTLP